jgi:hypothetical protein
MDQKIVLPIYHCDNILNPDKLSDQVAVFLHEHLRLILLLIAERSKNAV